MGAQTWRRGAALLAAGALLLGSLASCGKKVADTDSAYVKDKGTLIVGVTVFEPMNYKDANGNWTGFDTEFAEAVAEKLGVKAEFKVIDWDNKTLELDAKSIDCVWNGMTLNDSVRASMDCSGPYVANAQVVVTTADKAGEYTTVDSLKDKKIAVESGSAGQDAAEENGLTYTAVSAQSDALMEVASGAADACILDLTMAKSMTGAGTSYANLSASMNLTYEEYGIGFRKGSDLPEQVNAIMATLKSDGTLDALAEKYGVTLVK